MLACALAAPLLTFGADDAARAVGMTTHLVRAVGIILFLALPVLLYCTNSAYRCPECRKRLDFRVKWVGRYCYHCGGRIGEWN